MSISIWFNHILLKVIVKLVIPSDSPVNCEALTQN
jgi:hypothetical protein